MQIDTAVVLEGCGDRQAGGERSAEVVDKDVDLLAFVLGKLAINGRAVEIVVSDVTFSMMLYAVLDMAIFPLNESNENLFTLPSAGKMRLAKTNFATKFPLYKEAKKTKISRKITIFALTMAGLELDPFGHTYIP